MSRINSNHTGRSVPTDRSFRDDLRGGVPYVSPIAGALLTKYRIITVDLTNLRTDELQMWAGNFLWALVATTATSLITIRLQDQINDPIPFFRGIKIPPMGFEKVYISNTAQAAETISFMLATFEYGLPTEPLNA